MIRVADKEQIYSASFMAKDGEVALVEVPIGNEVLRVSFCFGPGEQNAIWKSEDGIVKFTISGWRNPLGTSITEPAKFGDVGNRKMFLQLAQYLIGPDNNLVHAFFFLGAPNV